MQPILNIVLVNAIFDYNAYNVQNLTEKQYKL